MESASEEISKKSINDLAISNSDAGNSSCFLIYYNAHQELRTACQYKCQLATQKMQVWKLQYNIASPRNLNIHTYTTPLSIIVY